MGAFLYNVGGFPTPFIGAGFIGILMTVLMIIIVPKVDPEKRQLSKKALYINKAMTVLYFLLKATLMLSYKL